MATRSRWLVWPAILVTGVIAVVVMLIVLSAMPKADAQNATQTQE
jgi:hypothetical protein